MCNTTHVRVEKGCCKQSILVLLFVRYMGHEQYHPCEQRASRGLALAIFWHRNAPISTKIHPDIHAHPASKKGYINRMPRCSSLIAAGHTYLKDSLSLDQEAAKRGREISLRTLLIDRFGLLSDFHFLVTLEFFLREISNKITKLIALRYCTTCRIVTHEVV